MENTFVLVCDGCGAVMFEVDPRKPVVKITRLDGNGEKFSACVVSTDQAREEWKIYRGYGFRRAFN